LVIVWELWCRLKESMLLAMMLLLIDAVSDEDDEFNCC
jgi:hypothetical protein